MYKCDECGQFVKAELMLRRLLTPDSEYTKEEYETLCPKHYNSPCITGAQSPELIVNVIRDN